VATVVIGEIGQYAVTLVDLAAAVGAQADITATEFAGSTGPFNSQRLPGAVDLSYVVPATPSTVTGVQAFWRARGAPGLTLHPPPSGEGFFTVLDRALDGGPSRIGNAAPAEIADTLRIARSSQMITVSHTYLDAAGQQSFVMATPIVATSPPSRNGQFRGWITMTFQARTFLGESIGLLAGDQLSATLNEHVGDRLIPIATWQPSVKADTSLKPRTTDIHAPQRMWSLTVRATENLLPTSEALLDTALAVVGGLITLLLAALTATVVTSRDRALRRVDQATAELRHDIERREEVEQQLRRREEELMGFAGVVAHDLRSPLATVTGHAELLAMTAADHLTGQEQRNLGHLRDSAGRMQALIDDLLGYATAENTALRLEDVDLNAVVDDILAERAAAPVASRADLPTVTGDPTLVRQVLDNLIGNAIKYTPPGQTPEITISALSEDDGLCRIEVADRGIGIPDHQRAEIFNAFTRAEGSEKYPGTGLGLAIVQRIVQRHGGTVGADPNPGGGTRFWLTLPAAAPSQRPV
jgi:signal transduction histidine kinase